MLAIEFRFPARRYHATPWGHHVNEGRVEWPPAPWRLLRALLACYHLKAPELERDVIRTLFHKLAKTHPAYALPESVQAHTRHYMPLGDADGKTTKIFDAFVHLLDDASLEVQWPEVVLDDRERAAMAVLVDRLGYLGRSESWVEGRLLKEPTRAANVQPAREEDEAVDRTKLLATIDPAQVEAWHSAALDERLTRELALQRNKDEARGKDPAKSKLSKKVRAKLEAGLPEDLLGLLEVDTDLVRGDGWNRPPGTRWVEYGLPPALTRPAPRRVPATLRRKPTLARFAIASNVLPRWEDTLVFAERVRRALMSRSAAPRDGVAAPVFAGKSDGKLLQGHQHAFVLPERMDRAGRITHFVVHAPMGFEGAAVQALQGLTQVTGGKGREEHPVQVVLIDLGTELVLSKVEPGSLFGPATVWRSATPFVATRHPKRRGGDYLRDEGGRIVGSPEHDLRRLLGLHGFPEPRSSETIDHARVAGRRERWRAFASRRTRGGGGRRAHAAPRGFRLEFAEAVVGPLALGFGAHFGLGLFLVDAD